MQYELEEFEFESVTVDKNGRIIDRHKHINRCFSIDLNNKVNLEMIEIPGGRFMMGATQNEAESRENEQPFHQVQIASFFMGKFPVTQAQWMAMMSVLPKMSTDFYGDRQPVVNVWLEQALVFCARLSNNSGLNFRLPSEAEWEYACRAGTTTPFNCGETIKTDLANYNGEPYDGSPIGPSRNKTTPVGQFAANAFGLCDMHGNVWEWCADLWHPDYNGAPTDGSAWINDGDRSYCVQRGGSWANRAGACRSAFRVGDVAHNTDNLVGLRVCMSK